MPQRGWKGGALVLLPVMTLVIGPLPTAVPAPVLPPTNLWACHPSPLVTPGPSFGSTCCPILGTADSLCGLKSKHSLHCFSVPTKVCVGVCQCTEGEIRQRRYKCMRNASNSTLRVKSGVEHVLRVPKQGTLEGFQIPRPQTGDTFGVPY